jgi:aryl-alcohol dehydrogenase-like predicted oxidoreductase
MEVVGKEVGRIGLGTNRLTSTPENHAFLREAVDAGLRLIDTAHVYTNGDSERAIGGALSPEPNGLVIATKGGLTRAGPGQWAPVGRPEYLRQCVELSLRRLKVDRIDLYQLHRIDPKVPVAETVGALKDLQQAGKIRHLGLSEVSVKEIEQAQKTAAIVSVQNLYNLANQQSAAVLDYCTKHQLGFIPWFPLAAGDIAKPGGPLDQAARAHRATVSQLALAWLLQKSPVMLPIPGTSSVKHFEENMGAAELALGSNDLADIEGAASSVSIQGARYSESAQRMIDR